MKPNLKTVFSGLPAEYFIPVYSIDPVSGEVVLVL
jgi:hypothetical protein